MKKLAYLFAIVMLPVFAAAQNSESTLMMKMFQLRGALLGKDSVMLTKLLADDVQYGHTSGLLQTKAQLIRSVMSGEQDYKTIAPSDMKIKVYEQSGVVSMNAKVGMAYMGNPLDLSMHILLIWVKDKDDWHLVARQAVKN